MKHTNTLKTLSFTSLCAISLSLSAGDDPVNCRTEVNQVPVYGGVASCIDIDSGVLVTQFVADSRSNIAFIVDNINGITYSCIALVPFAYLINVTEQVCDYTPLANFTARNVYDGTAVSAWVRIGDAAFDRDGAITGREWWVNGVFYGSSTPQLSPVETFTTYTIQYKVTDNDGYTDTQTKRVVVDPDKDPCSEGEPTC